ncbi:hypothetical protein [Alteribacillus iranensis]|uniref:Uncharacterized protein n=1 Tax=Alteribacillus iranensis TaxID=930128 RepID=A0A1I1Z6Y6_9BACI|nr:hypothetical protein [Alteribacillus iranensis]SFE27495.1 hypothetical protein SAMN05192532_10174 [Alteribacillus iranensis]
MIYDQSWTVRQKVIYREQTIEWLGKKVVEQEDWLYLYQDYIASPEYHYPLHDVFDISYKWQPGQIGYLYLHTSSGVRTFYIKNDPSLFIEYFKKGNHL